MRDGGNSDCNNSSSVQFGWPALSPRLCLVTARRSYPAGCFIWIVRTRMRTLIERRLPRTGAQCSPPYCLPPSRSPRESRSIAHRPAFGTATVRSGVAKDRAYVLLVSQHESTTERAERTSHVRGHRQKSRATHWYGFWASETVARDRGISSFSDRRCVAYRMEARAVDEQARGAYRRRTVTFLALWWPAARCCGGNGTGAGITVKPARATAA